MIYVKTPDDELFDIGFSQPDESKVPNVVFEEAHYLLEYAEQRDDFGTCIVEFELEGKKWEAWDICMDIMRPANLKRIQFNTGDLDQQAYRREERKQRGIGLGQSPMHNSNRPPPPRPPRPGEPGYTAYIFATDPVIKQNRERRALGL